MYVSSQLVWGLREAVARFLLTVTLFGLAGVAEASDDKAIGKELLGKARKLSDIRAEGASAFRLEGTFRITPKKDGPASEGTYTEIWVSKTKWRREELSTSFHNVEIGSGNRKWIAGSEADLLDGSLYGSPFLFSRNTPELEVTKISERTIDSVKVTCVESKSKWSKGIDCVDPGSGVFVLQEDASKSNWASFHHICTYRNYEKFGDHLFPRFARCGKDSGDILELTILKLVAESSPDEALFTRPADAIEYGTCDGSPTPPKALQAPDPTFPADKNSSLNGIVVLWTIVGEDGIPRNSRVARAMGPGFDQAALDALQNWRFKPATCEGVPMPVAINIEMAFRKF